MNKYELLRELASNDGLTFIETTSGMNGYPKNIQPALIGFASFKDVEAFAQEHGLDIMMFHRRDGWQLWERKGVAYEPMTITQDDYGDGYDVINKERAKDYYNNEVKPFLQDFDNIEDLKTFIAEQYDIIDELDRMNDDEAIITYYGEYWNTIEPKCIEWGFDTHNYVIGVIKP